MKYQYNIIQNLTHFPSILSLNFVNNVDDFHILKPSIYLSTQMHIDKLISNNDVPSVRVSQIPFEKSGTSRKNEVKE